MRTRSVWTCGLLASRLAVVTAGAQEGAPGVFAIDAERTDIHWRIYRAGPMARFGHSHVISVGALEGAVSLAEDASQSSFELEFPVAGLIIDDPELRNLYGEEFSTVPSAEDIEGTRENMLTEAVLDGERFLSIRVSGSNWTGPGEASIDLAIEILGRTIELTLPTEVVVDGDSLVASGSFTLGHEALGMTPFSVMMGAVQVGEDMDFVYEIHAERGD